MSFKIVILMGLNGRKQIFSYAQSKNKLCTITVMQALKIRGMLIISYVPKTKAEKKMQNFSMRSKSIKHLRSSSIKCLTAFIHILKPDIHRFRLNTTNDTTSLKDTVKAATWGILQGKMECKHRQVAYFLEHKTLKCTS